MPQFLALLRGVKLQKGWMQTQRFMEKLCFHPDSLEPPEFPFVNTVKVCLQNKPKSNANRQKRKTIILNHFRDKAARFGSRHNSGQPDWNS